MATVVAILNKFLLNGRVAGETAENYARLPAVYRPHTSLCGQVTSGDGHVTGGLAGTLFGTITPVVTTAQTRSISGVPSAQAFGTIKAALQFGPGYVPSAQAFGAITIRTAVSRSIGGVSSAQAFGLFTLKSVLVRSIGGVPSAQAFGTITPKTTVAKPTGGVPSAQAFGTITVKTVRTVAIGGVPSAQQFGTVTVLATYRVPLLGVGSAQAFGAIVTRSGFTKAIPGVPSAQAFGVIKAAYLVSIPGVPSAQQFSTPSAAQRFVVPGVPSAQAFGLIDAYIVYIEDLPCVDEDLGPLDCLTDVNPTILNEFLCGQALLAGAITYIDALPSEEPLYLDEILCLGTHDMPICGYPSPTVQVPLTICGNPGVICGGENRYIHPQPPVYDFDLEPAGCS